MNERVLKYLIWGIVLLLLQILIFKNINIGWGDFYYIHILVYPLLILFLPINIPRVYLMLIGFGVGMIVDLFYLSPGIHSSALVFLAFIRQPLLNILEPRGGYKVATTPTPYHLGLNWFLTYAAILMFLHHLFYFSIEIFTFDLMLFIWLKTIFSFIFSMLFILALVLITNPRY